MIDIQNCVPCCAHPTTIVVVDSYPNGPQHLSNLLGGPPWRYRFYRDPMKALEFLESNPQSSSFLPHWQRDPTHSHHLHSVAAADVVNGVLRRAFNPQRHRQIAAVLTRHAIFHINGPQLCQRVDLPHVQTLLLGPVNNRDEVIGLLSQGKINGFLDENHLRARLKQRVELACTRYFQGFSAATYDLLSFFDEHHPLFKASVKHLVESTARDVGAVEFYLCTVWGDFVLITATGRVYGLIVRGNAQLDTFLASPQAKRAQSSVLQALRLRTHLLCLPPQGHTSSPPPDQWRHYLQPAQPIDEAATIHHALVPDWVQLDERAFTPFAYCDKPALPIPIDPESTPHLF